MNKLILNTNKNYKNFLKKIMKFIENQYKNKANSLEKIVKVEADSKVKEQYSCLTSIFKKVQNK